MTKKTVGYTAVTGITVMLIIIGIIIAGLKKGASTEETVKKSLVYFYDYDIEELVFYEDGVKLDIDIGKLRSYSSYTVKVGNAGDAFYVNVQSGSYLYYNGVLKKIEKDIKSWITYWLSPSAKSIVYVRDNVIYIYDIVTDENRYICDVGDNKVSSIMDKVFFSPDGQTVIFSPYCADERDTEIWMYNDGETVKVMEHAVPPWCY